MSAKLGVQWLNLFRRSNSDPLIPDGFTIGYLYSFKATDHQTPKPIYKDSNESQVWENPIPIDASGMLWGLYYGTDEAYYLAVYDGKLEEGGSLIADIDNYVPDQSENPLENFNDFVNYFLNPEFRFFYTQKYEQSDLLADEYIDVAGEGWEYYRNNLNCNNEIEFIQFIAGQTVVPDNPLYFFRHTCSSVGTGGENRKDIVQRISDVTAFSNELVSIGFYASSLNSQNIEIIFIQDFGENGDASVETKVTKQLTSQWALYTEENLQLPSVEGKNIGSGNALYIGIRLPLNIIDTVKLTKFQLNRGDKLLTYDYKTEEQEMIRDKAYGLPEPTSEDVGLAMRWTGYRYEFDHSEVGTFLNSDESQVEGCVLADGNTYSILDYTPNGFTKFSRLYNSWDKYGDGNRYGYGEDGFYPESVYSDKVVLTNLKKETVIQNWVDNDTNLTFEVVREGGEIGIDVFYGFNFLKEITVENNHINNPVGPVPELTIYAREPGNFTMSLPDTDFVEDIIIYNQENNSCIGYEADLKMVRIIEDGNIFYRGKWLKLDMPDGRQFGIWFTQNGSGTQPDLEGRIPIHIDIPGFEFFSNFANYSVPVLIAQLNVYCDRQVIGFVGAKNTEFKIINKYVGAVTDPTIGTTDFTLEIIKSGNTELKAEYIFSIPDTETSANLEGKGFTFSTFSLDAYLWYKNEGNGTDPSLATIGFCVELDSSDTPETITYKTAKALEGTTSTKITTLDTASLGGAGSYFEVFNSVTNFVPYLVIDGVGEEPDIPGKVAVAIELESTDNANMVATKISKTIRSIFFNVPDRRGLFLRGKDGGRGIEKEALDRSFSGSITYGDKTGTLQRDIVGVHGHQPSQKFEESVKECYMDATGNTLYNQNFLFGGSETRPVNIATNWFVRF